MNKLAIKLGSAAVSVCLLFSMAGCSKTIERDESFGKKYELAVTNSMKADMYYAVETVNEGKQTYQRKINVLPALEGENSTPVKDENGKYVDLKIQVAITDFNGDSTSIQCGHSEASRKETDKNRDGNYRFYLVHEKNAADNQFKEARCKAFDPLEYYNSEEFSDHRIEALIAELNEISYADMNFDVKDAKQKTVGKVTTLVFAPTEEYLKEYESKHGEKSLFDGADRVLIETAYDRISNITVYEQENAAEGSKMSVEVERYKLEIVYLGPKISIPAYDETVKVNDKEVNKWIFE